MPRNQEHTTELTVEPQLPEERVNILIVDDRPDKILALSSVLQELGENLLTASSGKEALRLLLENEVAVILLDVSMPVMDGFEAASLIRQRKATERTPIIFISAINPAETHATRGYKLGAVDYIFAPVIPEILRAKVSVFIDQFRNNLKVKRLGDSLRAEAESRAKLLESRLHSLLGRLQIGVFRSTFDGMLLEANPAFYALLGIDPASPRGSLNLRNLYVHPRERDDMLCGLTQAGQTYEHIVQLRRRTGQVIWARMSKTLNIEPGKDRCIDGLIEDITERKTAEEALAVKAQELARTNDELEQFAYLASHDLQEPLRIVSSFSSLLERRYASQLDEQGRKFVQILIDSSARLQMLIRDILALSRIGKILSPGPVDCDRVVADTIFQIQGVIRESGTRIEAEPLPRIIGDEILIGQVFQNIISNAIKFRGQDPPLIRVSAKHVDGFWQFSIKDNGIGIAGEHHDKIFGIFQRLHTRTEYPGTGIGLAFCRKIIQHHGGTIWVESRFGEGATFHFTLTDAEPASEAPQVENPQIVTPQEDHSAKPA